MNPQQPRAIVVDDDEDIRKIVCRMLPLSGLEVVAELSSGEEAVDWMIDHDAAIVVMDIQMAGMGGTEATRRIKETKPETVIFGFTGWGTEEVAAMLEAGAVAVFDKTKLHELMRAIEEVI
ncbi:MAG TPA: response regulator transcription factor [Actinomycetota bacterium]|nr:response regulator transcription factor [Actinomycetota bacterium]